MSVRWEETLSSWRQFCDHWELGLQGDLRGARIDAGIDQVLEAADRPDWGGSQFLSRILDEEGFRTTEPIYVSDDVMTLWEYAWPSFEPEPLRPTDLFVANGFALFPRPIEYLQANADAPSCPLCRGLAWASDGSEAWAFAISHRDDSGEPRPHVWAIEMTTGFRLDNDALAAGDQDVQRQHQSFWRLAQQVLATDRKLPRARRREERRYGSTRDATTVLLLRRVERPESTDSVDVEWTKRWIVRGHWRNQWYPKLGIHRQIWISPYVKGPEDKPLVPTIRIVDFVR